MEYTSIESTNMNKKRNLLRQMITLSWLKKKTIVELIAHIFIILFLYTGISKLMDFEVFKAQLEDSPVLKTIAPVVAWGLPMIEFVVSILLFIPRYRLTGLYSAFSLMILFTGYVITILTIDKELPCSCGGIIGLLSWKAHLALNIILIGFAAIAIRLKKQMVRLI